MVFLVLRSIRRKLLSGNHISGLYGSVNTFLRWPRFFILKTDAAVTCFVIDVRKSGQTWICTYAFSECFKVFNYRLNR